MAFATVFSAQASLAKVTIISVEADLSRGLHAFSIVGLPDKALEEAWDRISAAIKNSGHPSPKSKNQKVVLSLAPSDVKKSGPVFDVPMALAYLLASDEIRFNPFGKIFLGELALDGKVRPIPGILALAREMVKHGFKEIYVPAANAYEASLISGIDVYPIHTLSSLIHELESRSAKKCIPAQESNNKDTIPTGLENLFYIQGNAHTKRMLEIAAAGGHHCALWGPPGTGKTMLAKVFADLVPSLSKEESLEVMAIYSVAGLLQPSSILGLQSRPPFRAPHHSASYGAILGGGSPIKAGELTLAHRGILFLDEFTEFNRQVIEGLREPLEEGVVRISRIGGSLTLPAKIILIVAFNPCPCGYFGSTRRECTCATMEKIRYRRRLSGPIIDRIDLWSSVQEIEYDQLNGDSKNTDSKALISEMISRIARAREIQKKRFRALGREGNCNKDLTNKDIASLKINPEALQLLKTLSKKSALSARGHYKIIKIAQTISDLEGREEITTASILEAFQYRPEILGELGS